MLCVVLHLFSRSNFGIGLSVFIKYGLNIIPPEVNLSLFLISYCYFDQHGIYTNCMKCGVVDILKAHDIC